MSQVLLPLHPSSTPRNPQILHPYPRIPTPTHASPLAHAHPIPTSLKTPTPLTPSPHPPSTTPNLTPLPEDPTPSHYPSSPPQGPSLPTPGSLNHHTHTHTHGAAGLNPAPPPRPQGPRRGLRRKRRRKRRGKAPSTPGTPPPLTFPQAALGGAAAAAAAPQHTPPRPLPPTETAGRVSTARGTPGRRRPVGGPLEEPPSRSTHPSHPGWGEWRGGGGKAPEVAEGRAWASVRRWWLEPGRGLWWFPGGLPPGRGRGPEAYRGPPQSEPPAAVTQDRGRRLGLKMSPRGVVERQGGQGGGCRLGGEQSSSRGCGRCAGAHAGAKGGGTVRFWTPKSNMKESYQALLEAVGWNKT